MEKKGRLAAWTYAHFAVDFSCFYVLHAGLKNFLDGDLETLAVGFLTYNVIAFGLQSAIGRICDERDTWRRASGFAGSIMVCMAAVIAALCSGAAVWAAMIVAALGNAFFHVGGGIDVLRRSGGKMTGSGVFVSSGAMGVALGTLCGSAAVALIIIISAAVLTGVIAWKETSWDCSRYVPFRIAGNGNFLVAIALLMTAVFIRSYAGAIMPVYWERTGWLVILPAAASCMGKALGGVAGDRLGAARTGVISLLISAPLICFGAENMILSLVGILMFNMTMPVTLCGLVSVMPQNPGFAFGLTTIALLAGSGITYFWAIPPALIMPVVAMLTLMAAVCIGLSVNNNRGKNDEKEI